MKVDVDQPRLPRARGEHPVNESIHSEHRRLPCPGAARLGPALHTTALPGPSPHTAHGVENYMLERDHLDWSIWLNQSRAHTFLI